LNELLNRGLLAALTWAEIAAKSVKGKKTP
jgi:hypothetical protein